MRFVLRFVVLTLLVAGCLLAAVPITITSNPVGTFNVEGSGCTRGGYTTPQTLDWTAGATCTVTFRSPQTVRWQDGVTSNPRTIVAPSQAVTYSASLASTLPPPPGSYEVTQISTGSNAVMNNSGQVAGISNNSVFLWTPLTPNGPLGTLVDIGSGLLQGSIAVNDRGQVVGTTSLSQAFLWSPDSPNGTSGTVTPLFQGTAAWDPSRAIAINTFGQITGVQAGTSFIWTPSSPNGTAGTLNTDSRLAGQNGIGGINDFGQAIVNNPASLFTPTVANGATGSFTPIPALPGYTNNYLIAINRGGTILGESCTNAGCDHGFLWTPTAANGATGTAVEIPLPLGYASMYPAALNAGGQVVGMITAGGGVSTPFLYSGGTMYDLSILGGVPAAINDQGQILINTPAGAAVATLGILSPAPGPGTVAITIATAFNLLRNPLLSFTVTGAGCNPGGYNTPQTLYWIPGSNCTVTFLSPQSVQIGTRFVFQSWQDGATTNPRVIVAPAQAATYTAAFTTQYLVAAGANPPQGGSVSGGGWYTAGAAATLGATPAAGYRLLNWSPSPPIVPPASTSATVTVVSAQTITVNFEPLSALPPNYLVSQIALGSRATAINNFGQVVGSSPGLPNGAFLWTPVAANSPAGTMTTIDGPKRRRYQ